jgi:hypothetical protein
LDKDKIKNDILIKENNRKKKNLNLWYIFSFLNIYYLILLNK